MTTFTTDDRVSAELEVLPSAITTATQQVPIAFQCFRTPEHYVLEANIPEEIEYIRSLGFQRLVPLYDHPPPQEWVISAKYKDLTDEEIIKTMVQFDVYSADDQCLIEAGRAILRKAQEKSNDKCGDSYDTVCPPSICDCRGKAQEK